MGNECGILPMCSVEIATVKDSDGLITLGRQIAEETDKADFIVDFELRSRRHLRR